MEETPSVMVNLLQRLPVNRGVEYLTTARALRRYLDSITDEQFAEECSFIKEEWLFRHLLSMGLSKERQTIIVADSGRLK